MSIACDPNYESCTNITIDSSAIPDPVTYTIPTSDSASAYALSYPYEALFDAVNFGFVVYGFFVYKYNILTNTNNTSGDRIIELLCYSIFGFYGFESLLIAANILLDFEGGYIHQVFAYSVYAMIAPTLYVFVLVNIIQIMTTDTINSYWEMPTAYSLVALEAFAIFLTQKTIKANYDFFHSSFNKCYDRSGKYVDCGEVEYALPVSPSWCINNKDKNGTYCEAAF